MTAITVVDASVAGAVLFVEKEGDVFRQKLSVVSLVAPAILPLELANVCLSKCRRHPGSRAALIAQFEGVFALDIDLREVDIRGVRALAEETGLTAYDASYLWLARVLDADLVTLDRELAKAYASLTR